LAQCNGFALRPAAAVRQPAVFAAVHLRSWRDRLFLRAAAEHVMPSEGELQAAARAIARAHPGMTDFARVLAVAALDAAERVRDIERKDRKRKPNARDT